VNEALILGAAGAVCIGFAMLQLAGFVGDLASIVDNGLRKLVGRPLDDPSEMTKAGAWVQALIIMVVGCAMLAAGVSTMWS
jgi:hypothetical protein